MNTHSTLRSRIQSLCGAALGLALLTHIPLASAAASFTPGGQSDPNLEIDANIENAGVTDELAYPGDDWETVYKTKENILPRQTLNSNIIDYTWVADPAPQSIFTGGGSKDVNDISQWKYTNGSVPDKDDITHAMAAAYSVAGSGGNELVLYLGADRYSNDGDAEMGAWFFQDQVKLNADGTFSGTHKNGDLLWIGEFSKGGQVSTLKVLVWNDPALANYRSNLTQVKGTMLSLLISGTGGTFYSAAVNDKPMTPTVWPYTPKSGDAGTFPISSFMEGGINLSGLLGGTLPCYSSFMMETRSSSEVNAQLKDFVLGNLNTCRITVTKSCTSSVLNTAGTAFIHSYSVSVTNTGFGTLTSVSFVDNNATPDNTADDLTSTYSTPIPTGTTVTGAWTYTTENTLNPPTNTVYATGHVGSISTAQVSAQSTCEAVPLSPKISVTKYCATSLEAQADPARVVVKSSITSVSPYLSQVCNTDKYDATNCPTCTNSKLKNVTVKDDKIGSLLITVGSNLPATSVSLDPGQCGSIAGYYYPSSVVGTGAPKDQEYNDTVTAVGYEQISNTKVTSTDTATCKLCEPGDVCPK